MTDSTVVREHEPSTPVGTSDSLINAAARHLTPWVEMWREAEPGFRPDSLIRVGTAPAFRGGYVQPLKNVYPPPAEQESAFRVLSARSPDGRYNLIFDWYQNIEESGDELDISGEPDSAPLLLDQRLGISNQFETCGTGCSFDWGVWLSPSSFALAGWQDEEGMGRHNQGRLKIYSLADSTSTTYVTQLTTAKGRDAYRAAWEKWVASRYHALKTRPPS